MSSTAVLINNSTASTAKQGLTHGWNILLLIARDLPHSSKEYPAEMDLLKSN